MLTEKTEYLFRYFYLEKNPGESQEVEHDGVILHAVSSKEAEEEVKERLCALQERGALLRYWELYSMS